MMLQDGGLERQEPANDHDIAEPLQEGQADVGSILKRTRAQSGYTLEQIGQSLNIRLQHLAAIEESRFNDLPGVPYAVGFVKAYASFLGLDDHAVVARYKEEIQVVPSAQRLVFPEPVDEARVPKGTVVAVSLAAALAIYGVWYFVSSYDAVRMVTVPQVPDRIAPSAVGPKSILPASVQANAPSEAVKTASADKTAAPAPAPQAKADSHAAEKSSPAQASSSSETAANTPAKTEKTEKVEKTEPVAPAKTPVASTVVAKQQAGAPKTVDNSASNVPDATDTADSSDEDADSAPPPPDEVGGLGVAAPETTVASVAPPQVVTPSADQFANAVADQSTDQAAPDAVEEPHVPKIYGSPAPDVRVVLKAGADSWVQVEAPDQEILLSRVLKAGDSYRVPNREGLMLMTGNAGALDIKVDGQSIGSLGPLGAVRRNVALAPEALENRATTARN